MDCILRECVAKVLRRFRIPGRGLVVDLTERILGPNHGEFIVPLRHSGRLIIDGIADRPVFYIGGHEWHVMDFLVRAVDKGNTVVDVGAGIGTYTVPLALKVGPAGHVYAFEALKPNYELLLRNIKLNNLNNVTAIYAAITDTTGFLEVPTFDARPGGLGNYSLASQSSRHTTISSWCLDDFTAHYGISRIDLLKIDIEGSEVRAVRGMKRLFSHDQIRTTCCEFNRCWLQRMGSTSEELYNLFSDHGLKIYRLTRLSNLREIDATYIARAPHSWDGVAKRQN